MGFNAVKAVAKLDYDFTGLDVDSLKGVKGTTPEPTADQVTEMRFKLRKLFSLDEDADVTEKMASLSEQELKDRDKELAEIYADVCSQEPTTEQILALPHRVLQAYIGWLSGELNNPSAGTSGTKR